MKQKINIAEFENKIKYVFRDKDLLEHAMRHSSYTNEHHMDKNLSNERLEFLGDAVLEITVSEFLFHSYPCYPEGQLTRQRASIVCEPTLALCSEEISLGKYILLGKGEEMTGGRQRASVVSDAMEALIGAIYLDGGFASAKEFIERFILTDIENKQLFYDSKTILQEIVQSGYEEPLLYELVKEEGPDHKKLYEVNAKIGKTVIGSGKGGTKKAAEQEAAYKGILKIRRETECI